MNITISYFENADNLLFYFIIIPFYLCLWIMVFASGFNFYYTSLSIIIGIMLIASRYQKPHNKIKKW